MGSSHALLKLIILFIIVIFIIIIIIIIVVVVFVVVKQSKICNAFHISPESIFFYK